MNKYINKAFAGIAIAVSAISLTSCGSDYLDTAPTESAAAAAAVESYGNAIKSLNGIAKSMSIQQSYYGQGFAGENAIMRIYENLPSQNYNYNAYAGGWADIHNQELHLRSDSKYDHYAWFYYYQIISQANAIIAHIADMKGTQEEKDAIKASALTFRAYGFEKLMHYYCYRWQDSNNGAERGIVLRLDESIGNHKIATMAESYAQIYKDLDEAIQLYASSGKVGKRDPQKVWMPTVNVAHAVYARAALTKQDYKVALEHAKLAREGYALMNGDEERAGFCRPTSEWILGSYGDPQEQNWYWAYAVQGACNGYYAKAADTGAGTMGAELLDKIPTKDARKKMYLAPDQIVNASGTAFITRTNTEQVNQTFGIINDDTEAYKAASKYVEENSVAGLAKPYQSGVLYLDGQLKFWAIDQPGVSYVPFIRSSEMVLIEAEANYFLNNASGAQASLVELNATSGRNPAYTCTLTGAELLKEIQTYRCFELWGEGFEWSDFKRWNLPIVRKTFDKGGNAHPSVAVTIKPQDANKWTWEIPKAESDFNDFGADLTQPKAP